ncbi:DUF3035 domain-containing protein [Candidatus Pelagibacter sp.]|jgi:hypothetical protein|nr:DUF3035 domain-containing protein [Candidatus Pelagibacter sp.]
MIKNIILIFTITITLFSCSGLRKELSLKKEKSVDEFLIQKKNPLVLPPDYSELPVPRKSKAVQEEKNIDLNSVLTETDQKNSISSTQSNTLEKSISEILRNK